MTESPAEHPEIRKWVERSIAAIPWGEPHRHHRDCIHNLPADEQLRVRQGSMSDELWAVVIDGQPPPVQITPDDWEIDLPIPPFPEGNDDA